MRNYKLESLFVAVATLTAVGCSSSKEATDVADEALSAAACSSLSAWAAGVTYATGADVIYNGEAYKCIQGHTSQSDWTPSAVPALWQAIGTCSGSSSGGGGSSGGGSSGGGSTGGGSSSGGSSGSTSTCDANAWVYMGSDANACVGHVGESCGWTSTNENQGYHCQAVSWGTGCESGGASCPAGGGSSGGGSTGGGGSSGGGSSGGGGDADAGSSGGGSSGGGSSGGGSSTGGGTAPAGLIFSPYKDTSINMNWNTNVITTDVSGSATSLASDLTANGGKTITLAFATGECGSENWGGVAGAAMAAANVSLLRGANVNYILSTGGAAGSFTCGTDSGFETFINSWSSSNLIGVDFDIEAGQSQSVINDLVARIKTAHGAHPGLRFSLTLATLAVNNGASTAQSLGSSAQDSFNVYGDNVMSAVESTLGFSVGNSSSWPSYVTVDLMVMDYGSPSDGVCVVSGGECEMGQSALQAAYNLHDKWGVPYSNIELTPMIGGNDAAGETFTLSDADTVAKFAISQGLAGVHYWSYDRDVDCAPGSASATCNSYGSAGSHGFLKRFLGDGL